MSLPDNVNELATESCDNVVPVREAWESILNNSVSELPEGLSNETFRECVMEFCSMSHPGQISQAARDLHENIVVNLDRATGFANKIVLDLERHNVDAGLGERYIRALLEIKERAKSALDDLIQSTSSHKTEIWKRGLEQDLKQFVTRIFTASQEALGIMRSMSDFYVEVELGRSRITTGMLLSVAEDLNTHKTKLAETSSALNGAIKERDAHKEDLTDMTEMLDGLAKKMDKNKKEFLATTEAAFNSTSENFQKSCEEFNKKYASRKLPRHPGGDPYTARDFVLRHRFGTEKAVYNHYANFEAEQKGEEKKPARAFSITNYEEAVKFDNYLSTVRRRGQKQKKP
jgi:hypothetical protein